MSPFARCVFLSVLFSVILSVARAVIHDMLHLVVHQGCDPFYHSAVSQNGHHVGASSRYGTGAVIRFALVSERGSSTLVTSSMLRWDTRNKVRFELVTYIAAVAPRFGDVADEVARRTTHTYRQRHTYRPISRRTKKGGRPVSCSSQYCGEVHQEQTSALDHGNSQPWQTRSTRKT